ncbi:putative quinol monooxygenase [Streptomyces sp. I05A-00742]|uniref:putative quinol monooxygenase n=1 Tax=Streptomyces sp. I05A-00742 TaxID=2732853 RepID=UPI0014899E12|nr:antibiotic biosynthesis monooxygenase [Streptomyces sp. I05A-00742]
MTAGFGLVVRFTLRGGEEVAAVFDELASRTLEGIRRHEPRTLVYATHRVPDEPAVRVFYELYADRAAFDEHERQPHVRHFLAEREEYVDRVDVTFLEHLDGKA